MNSKDIDFENLPIYIIHCANNEERKRIILSQLEQLGSKNITIVEAVTPETINLYEDYEKYHDMFGLSAEYDRRSVCGTISHRIIHTLAEKQNQDYFLTLEDDFKVLDHFAQWKVKVKEKNFEFDILSMGGFYDEFTEDWITNLGDEELYGIKKVNCSVAIFYAKSGSKRFVELFDEHFSKTHNAIDGLMSNFVYRAVESRSLYPNPISVYPTVSTINRAFVDHESFYTNLSNK